MQQWISLLSAEPNVGTEFLKRTARQIHNMENRRSCGRSDHSREQRTADIGRQVAPYSTDSVDQSRPRLQMLVSDKGVRGVVIS